MKRNISVLDLIFDKEECERTVAQIKAENKRLRNIIREVARQWNDPGYFLKPEIEEAMLEVAAEEDANACESSGGCGSCGKSCKGGLSNE